MELLLQHKSLSRDIPQKVCQSTDKSQDLAEFSSVSDWKIMMLSMVRAVLISGICHVFKIGEDLKYHLVQWFSAGPASGPTTLSYDKL